MKEKLQVSVAIAQRELLEDSVVTIEGIFVMKRGVGYFVQSLTDVDQCTRAIFVDSPSLEQKLLASVPAYAGSQYSYCHEAGITGSLRSNSLAEFSCGISDIRDFVVDMDGQPFAVSLDS